MHDGHRRLQEAFEKNKVLEKESVTSSALASVQEVQIIAILPSILFILKHLTGRK